MNFKNVKLILFREIRDQLRDRRTLFMIFVLPILLYPLLGMSLSQVVQFRRARPTAVLVVGKPALGNLPALFQDGAFAPQPGRDAARDAELLTLEFATAKPCPDGPPLDAREEACRAVQSGKYDAALVFPTDFAQRLQAFRQAIVQGKQRAAGAREGDGSRFVERNSGHSPAVVRGVPSPEILFTTANERSQIASARLSGVLQCWMDEVGRQNLLAGGVPVSAVRPFELKSRDLAEETAYRGAAVWSKILPVMLLLWAMTGAFYPAVDLCAGEKERGTLETLLSSPAERSEIVLGKLLTIMVFSIATAALNLLSMGIAGWLIFGRVPEFGPPPPWAIVWLSLALLPVSALYSALCLALAAFARSTREGQYYLVPLLLVTMPLAVLPMAPGVELTLGNSLIPVTGVVLLLRNMIEGSYWQALQYLPVVLGVTLAACFLAVRWAVDQFNSETVLFRESERLDVGLWLRHLLRDRQPTPTVAAAVLCGVLILMIRFAIEGFARPDPSFAGIARLTAVMELAAVTTPALLMAVVLTSNPRRTLLLTLPHWTTIPAAVALAASLHPLANVLQQAVVRLYPMGEDVRKALQLMQQAMVHAPLWQLLLLLAVTPAICEELAFRGFILSGFRHMGHRGRAIVFSAVFFALIHSILQQSLIACLMGIIIGLLAVQTNSLLPGVLFHMTHNGLLVAAGRVLPALLQRWPALKPCLPADAEGNITYRWPLVLASGLVATLILLYFVRLRAPKSAEEQLQEAIARGAGEVPASPEECLDAAVSEVL